MAHKAVTPIPHIPSPVMLSYKNKNRLKVQKLSAKKIGGMDIISTKLIYFLPKNIKIKQNKINLFLKYFPKSFEKQF